MWEGYWRKFRYLSIIFLNRDGRRLKHWINADNNGKNLKNYDFLKDWD